MHAFCALFRAHSAPSAVGGVAPFHRHTETNGNPQPVTTDILTRCTSPCNTPPAPCARLQKLGSDAHPCLQRATHQYESCMAQAQPLLDPLILAAPVAKPFSLHHPLPGHPPFLPACSPSPLSPSSPVPPPFFATPPPGWVCPGPQSRTL